MRVTRSIHQVRKILAACNPAVPTEDLVVRILVGSGLRREELCGLAVVGPDGLSDVMTDSLGSGRVELRVRWNAGAKGRKSRRVPITPKLAAAIKRYEARHRGDTDLPQLLINDLEAIERARVLRGWTRRELARRARIDEGTLCDLVAGRRRPTFGTLRAICQSLELGLGAAISFDG